MRYPAKFMTAMSVTTVLALSSPSLASADDPSSYTVRPGDSLWLIADLHDVPIADLLELNGLTTASTIHPGQVLTIRDAADDDRDGDSPSEGGRVTVRPGDSLWSIAERVGSSLRALLAANDLVIDSTIHPDQVLALPPRSSTTAPTTTQEPTPTATTPDESGGATSSYVVRPGDALSLIASDHGITVRALLDANSLSIDAIIHPGQRLVIPAPTGPAPVSSRGALLPVFRRAAAEFGVPADLLMAVAFVESRWDPAARSSSGAVGIGQLMPSTARWIAEDLIGEPDLDPADPTDNIRMSARLLAWLLDEAGGDTDVALAMYLQGVYGVRAHGVSAAATAYAARVAAIRPQFV